MIDTSLMSARYALYFTKTIVGFLVVSGGCCWGNCDLAEGEKV